MMRVSVLVPVFDSGEVVGQAVDNLLGQTEPPAEIIIADDGSRDGLADRVAALRTRCEARGVALVHVGFPENRGRGAARNLALDAATGNFVAWYDVDDLWSLEKLAVQQAGFERIACEHPSGKLLLTCAYRRYADGDLFNSRVVCPYPTTTISDLVALYHRRHIQLQTVFGPRDAFLQHRFDDGLNRVEDFDFAIRYAASGGKFVNPDPDGEPLVHYFSNGSRAIDEVEACNRRVVASRREIFWANHVAPSAFLASKLGALRANAPPLVDTPRPAVKTKAQPRLVKVLSDGSLLIRQGAAADAPSDADSGEGDCVVLTAEGVEITRLPFEGASRIAQPTIVDWFMAGGRLVRLCARCEDRRFCDDLRLERRKSGLISVSCSAGSGDAP